MLLERVGQIKKRDGWIVAFEEEKIIRAVHNALKAVGDVDINRIKASMDMLKSSNIEIEFRTTFVPHLVTVDDIEEISSIIGNSGM
jgi:pyruvate-formate lyase-activating enzyme